MEDIWNPTMSELTDYCRTYFDSTHRTEMKKSVFVVPGMVAVQFKSLPKGVFILEHAKAIASNYDVVVILCVYQKQFVPGFSISKDQSHGF